VEGEVGVLVVQAESKVIHPKRQRRIDGVCHARDYTLEALCAKKWPHRQGT